MKNNDETKREKFVRLAEARTNKIIAMIQLWGNCANTAAYEYTKEDVDKIFSAIEYELKEARRSFVKAEEKSPKKFKL